MGVRKTLAYTFSGILSVELHDLTSDLLSKVIETAVKASGGKIDARLGGTSLAVHSVEFSLSPALASNLTLQAEARAVTEAKSQAQRYATVSVFLAVHAASLPRSACPVKFQT